MANNEFHNINEFIEGFTRKESTPNKCNYDSVINGIEFLFNGKIYRISRDLSGFENKLRKKFKKTCNAYISFFEIPINIYPDASCNDINLCLGIYDNVDELLNDGEINGIKLKDIIASNKTVILAIE